jgi:hypothetical protein
MKGRFWFSASHPIAPNRLKLGSTRVALGPRCRWQYCVLLLQHLCCLYPTLLYNPQLVQQQPSRLEHPLYLPRRYNIVDLKMSRLDQGYRETETSEAPDDIAPAHAPDFDWEHSSGSEEYEPEESMGDKWDTIRLAEIAVKGLEDDLDMLKQWEGAKKDKLMSKWQRKLGTARSAVISAQTDFDAEFERLKNEGRSVCQPLNQG